MPYCILARHGRSTANADGVLAGWLPVALDETGRAQAVDLADRLGEVTIAHLVSSPLRRCLETAAPLAERTGLDLAVHEGLAECRYGGWTGRRLTELADEPLWRTVQDDPGTAAFPTSPEHEGESLRAMADRAVAAVAEIDAEVAAAHGPDAVWVAFSHGDVIKAVLADALGAGLANFQRVHVDPASLSLVRRGEGRPMVLRVNDTGRALQLAGTERPDTAGRPGDAVVGGGAG